MPINPNALSGSQPAEDPKPDAPAAEEPKRTRRTKAQMIADAVVPADDAQVELKDSGTGAKIERPWLVALEMVRDNKAEFADKAMKYAMQKHDQQKAVPAFEQPEVDQGDPVPAAEQIAKSVSVPPGAAIGDEVRVGSETFRVGHDRTLTSGPVSVDGELVQAKLRWQRELGAGIDGPWEFVSLQRSSTPEKAETNGKGRVLEVGAQNLPVEPVALPEGVEVEQVSLRGWRVGTGVLEKIGLPDYSSLQIGPITASREVFDDGRRTQVEIGSREAVIPTACIEVAQQACDIVEYIARYQRGELVSFLESTGALKQPVS